jgi:nicotinamide riboside kinase
MDKRGLKVGLVGVPGSGKTTLATKLAGCVRERLGFKVVSLVQEYARTYIGRYGLPGDIWEQRRILEKQIAEEDRVANCDVMITDCPYPIGWLYSLDLCDFNNPKDCMQLSDLFSRMCKLNVGYRYDLIMHLPPVLDPVADGVRAEYQFEQAWRWKFDSDLQFVFRQFPPRKFELLNVELPGGWDKMPDLERRNFVGKERLEMALELISGL